MTSTPTVLPAGLARIRQQMGPYVPGQLSTGEKFWRDHFRWLHERGYKLRPRYHPNWEPSWKKEGRKDNTYVDVDKYADGISLTYVTAIDAVRLRDNRQVYLKRVFWNTHPHEVTISQLFSNSRMQADARNHCVPISETLDLPEGNGSILVMPFLRPFDDPPFLTVGEAIDCIQQLFEGIAFMHEKGYAHRDCTANNIMFDPREIFPRLYHPVKIHRNMELTGSAKYSTRTLHPPRYYFIDLGLTGYYGSPTHPPLVDQIWGGDKTVPEFQRSSNPCDPFATDVYYIGNVVRTRLLQRYKGLEFLESLVARMVDGAPQKRPLMSAIVNEFNGIRRNLSRSRLQSRLRRHNEFAVAAAWRQCVHLVCRVRYVLRRVGPIGGESIVTKPVKKSFTIPTPKPSKRARSNNKSRTIG